MTTKTRPKRGGAGGIDFGHNPGQVCPFCWEWFKGADLIEKNWTMAPLTAPRLALVEWYRRFLDLNPGPVPTPQGIEDYPALAAMLAEHRAKGGKA